MLRKFETPKLPELQKLLGASLIESIKKVFSEIIKLFKVDEDDKSKKVIDGAQNDVIEKIT